MNIEHSQIGRGAHCGYVYRCFDADGQALYVGMTRRDWVKRLEGHHGKTWWHDVTRVEVVDVRNRDRWALNGVERREITRLRPLHNRHHNPDWRWSFYASTFLPASLPYRGIYESKP